MPTIKVEAAQNRLTEFVISVDGIMLQPSKESQEAIIKDNFEGGEHHRLSLWIWGEPGGTLKIKITNKSGNKVYYNTHASPLKILSRSSRTRTRAWFQLVELDDESES